MYLVPRDTHTCRLYLLQKSDESAMNDILRNGVCRKRKRGGEPQCSDVEAVPSPKRRKIHPIVSVNAEPINRAASLRFLRGSFEEFREIWDEFVRVWSTLGRHEPSTLCVSPNDALLLYMSIRVLTKGTIVPRTEGGIRHKVRISEQIIGQVYNTWRTDMLQLVRKLRADIRRGCHSNPPPAPDVVAMMIRNWNGNTGSPRQLIVPVGWTRDTPHVATVLQDQLRVSTSPKEIPVQRNLDEVEVLKFPLECVRLANEEGNYGFGLTVDTSLRNYITGMRKSSLHRIEEIQVYGEGRQITIKSLTLRKSKMGGRLKTYRFNLEEESGVDIDIPAVRKSLYFEVRSIMQRKKTGHNRGLGVEGPLQLTPNKWHSIDYVRSVINTECVCLKFNAVAHRQITRDSGYIDCPVDEITNNIGRKVLMLIDMVFMHRGILWRCPFVAHKTKGREGGKGRAKVIVNVYAATRIPLACCPMTNMEGAL